MSKKKGLDFPGPRCSSDLLRREGKNTSEAIREDCVCPLAKRTQMSTAPKRETNLNVKVSIINHLGGRGHSASPGQSIGSLAANKVLCTLVCVSNGGCYLAK